MVLYGYSCTAVLYGTVLVLYGYCMIPVLLYGCMVLYGWMRDSPYVNSETYLAVIFGGGATTASAPMSAQREVNGAKYKRNMES